MLPRAWLRASLGSELGASSPALEELAWSLACSSASPEALRRALQDAGWPRPSHEWAEQLHARAQGKPEALPRQTASHVPQRGEYALVDMVGGEEHDRREQVDGPPRRGPRTERVREEEEDDDKQQQPGGKRKARTKKPPETDRERLEGLMGDGEAYAQEREDRRVAAAATAAAAAAAPAASLSAPSSMDDLRDQSRVEYLKKRVAQQVKINERVMEDEAKMFAMEELTPQERVEREAKLKVIELTKKAASAEPVSAFQMSSDTTATSAQRTREYEATKPRWDDRGVAPPPSSSIMEWEHHQLHRVVKEQQPPTSPSSSPSAYPLLLASQVDFVSESGTTAKKSKKHHHRHNRAEKDGPPPRPTQLTMQQIRASLPIFQHRDVLIQSIKDHQVLIVVGETGSGKTTQLPQYLYEEGFGELGVVGCTQPRRVAAMSVAARVAQETSTKLGDLVGYSIRFEDRTSKERTKIKYMTDGMLLREFMTSPDLHEYSVLMIDEAHERTLHTDILLGLLKDLCRYRREFRLVIASATMDAGSFSSYFDDAPIYTVPGKPYPVEVFYTKAPEADYVEAAIATVLQIHLTQDVPGDILVFLTGQDEIEHCRDELLERIRPHASKIKELIVCPIFSQLPVEEQGKVFLPAPPGARKVVVATNIAETSLTIDGILYVVDSGFVKQTAYNPRTGMESLVVVPISRAGAEQRRGRAGRTAPGKCFRLYTAWSFENELEPMPVPEIQRANLSNVVLLLKTLGIDDLPHFEFLDPPSVDALAQSLDLLYALGALNSNGELTRLGYKMAEFPTDPQLAKAILAAEAFECVEDVLTICAMLDAGSSVFYTPPDKAVLADAAHKAFRRGIGMDGDHLLLKVVYDEWKAANYSRGWCQESFVQFKSMTRAREVRDQLSGLCDRVELTRGTARTGDSESIRKAIASGYFLHLCTLSTSHGGGGGGNTATAYVVAKTRVSAYIHPSSSMYKREPPAPCVLYHQLRLTSKEFMMDVMPVDVAWISIIAPHVYPNGLGENPAKARKAVASAMEREEAE